MSASAIYFIDLKGKVLIFRNYRGDVPNSCIDKFIKKVIKEEKEKFIPPIFEDSGFNYCFVKQKDIYLVMVTKTNCNAMMVMCYLYQLISVFNFYFKELEEESLKDNFVVVYELLDEMMDFGFPQSTETNTLKEFIKMETHQLTIDTKAIMNLLSNLNLGSGFQNIISANLINLNEKIGKMSKNLKHTISGKASENTSKKITIPKHFTKQINWRKEGIVHQKNEVFLDVVESINIIVSSTGQTLKSEICGALKMRCFLSGMPDLKMGLNDKVLYENLGRSGKVVELEDVKFHQCVRLNKFETDRTIIFVPPDGNFDLMTYRLSTKVKPLIHVDCKTKLHSETRIEYRIRVIAQFKKKSTANSVKIKLPCPSDADSPICLKCQIGSVEYEPETDHLVWIIPQLQGRKEYVMRCQVGLPSVSNGKERYREMKKRPINVLFEIPYYIVSGLQVRYLKISEHKLGYQALPWVRYITQNGTYQLRQKK